MEEDLKNTNLDFLKKIISIPLESLESLQVTKVSPNKQNEYDSFKLYNDIFLDIDKDKLDELDDLDPEVLYSQKFGDKELRIVKTINGQIVIDNDFDMITIEKDQVDFFINIINLLK